MEVKDLRIGNYVEFHHVTKGVIKNFSKVGSLSIGIDKTIFSIGVEDYHFIADYKGIKPIPLTEEWLLKFGFKTDFYGGQGNVCYYASKGKFKIYSIEDNKSYQYDYTLNMFTMIKHVHELQNLYHALTGEELTIKE